jgi:hypothetical protein
MRPLCLLVVLLAATGAARGATPAPAGLDDALAARSLLGGNSWARLLRVENHRSGGIWKRHPYPKVLYALVFELSGILWFYTDVDGTQSLSLTLGTVARDEADPGPLLRSIDPGFAGWSWVEPPPGPLNPASPRPRNGCFVESVAALNRRLAGGYEAASPRLLSYYVETTGGRLGHTVLLFGTAAGLSAIDPGVSDLPVEVPSDLAGDPAQVSAFLRGRPVAYARTLPITGAGKPPRRWAALSDEAAPAG